MNLNFFALYMISCPVSIYYNCVIKARSWRGKKIKKEVSDAYLFILQCDIVLLLFTVLVPQRANKLQCSPVYSTKFIVRRTLNNSSNMKTLRFRLPFCRILPVQCRSRLFVISILFFSNFRGSSFAPYN